MANEDVNIHQHQDQAAKVFLRLENITIDVVFDADSNALSEN